MNDTNDHNEDHNKHLLSAESLADAADADQDTDLTRERGQGNGERVNGIYFAAVSLVALIAVIALIVVAIAMM